MNSFIELIQSARVATVKATDSILDCMVAIDDADIKLGVITDQEGKFEGCITDGDIRRGLIKGFNPSDEVSKLLCKYNIICKITEPIKSIEEVMLNNGVSIIPLVDEFHFVKAIAVQKKEQEKRSEISNFFVIMAGGQGQRLRPMTETCPKPMLLVNSKPILEHIIKKAMAEGFRNFVISINYLSNQIVDYFGDGSRLGANIKYICEENYRGTAGSLSELEPDSLGFPCVITNGDVIASTSYRDLIDFHKQQQSSLTVVGRLYYHQIPYGVLRTDKHRILAIMEKPEISEIINTGIYAISEEVLDYIPRTASYHMTDLINRIVETDYRIISYIDFNQWLDVGRPEDYNRASEFLYSLDGLE